MIEAEEGSPLIVDGMVRLVTEASVWFITADRYMRMPRTETPRDLEPCIGERLADGTWHAYRAASWTSDSLGRRLRIWPVVGWYEGALGIVTGAVEEVRDGLNRTEIGTVQSWVILSDRDPDDGPPW